MSWMNNKVDDGNTLYHPLNVEKYVGDVSKIVCRSSWERAVCKWLDVNPSVIQWASEPLAIPYVDPTQKDIRGLPKKRRYFPDFLAKIKDGKGEINIWLIEVKPYKETIPPKKGKKSKQTILNEEKTWLVNTAKWKAAQSLCNQKNWKFRILTEKDLKI